MHLSPHSLRQLDKAYLDALDEAGLRVLSVKLLEDLKEARDRLNQGPDNSSRPPSSRVPWEHQRGERGLNEDPEDGDLDPEPAEANLAEATPVVAKPARKAGKQPGTPGIGRTQLFQAHAEQSHYSDACAGCGRPLDRAGAVAYTGFQAVDLRWGDPARPGLTLWVVDHCYYEMACTGGHRTRAAAGHGVVAPLLAGVELSAWRLVGPGLAALIVGRALRFRLSRARIQECLREWLGLTLSIGTIHQTIHEASAAVAPAAELIQTVLDNDLLHADETSWPERGRPLWLWVFTAATVTLYYVAGRGKELVDNVLDGFTGWLMSEGWGAYRDYGRRRRCWAHLLRKARGLAQSWDRDARAFGQLVLSTLEVLMAAVYAAREGPPPVDDLPPQHAPTLAALRTACKQHQGHPHAKTHALAVEWLNDWEAIFQVLRYPELPLTNNEAERALRHWVILRKLSLGTRPAVGSRVVARRASVIDTCRQRGHSPWRYLERAITDRRAGQPRAAFPR